MSMRPDVFEKNIDSVQAAAKALEVKKQMELTIAIPDFSDEGTGHLMKLLLTRYGKIGDELFVSLGEMYLESMKSKALAEARLKRQRVSDLAEAKKIFALLQNYTIQNQYLNSRLNLALSMFQNWLDGKPQIERPQSYMESALDPAAFLTSVRRIIGPLGYIIKSQKVREEAKVPAQVAKAA